MISKYCVCFSNSFHEKILTYIKFRYNQLSSKSNIILINLQKNYNKYIYKITIKKRNINIF